MAKLTLDVTVDEIREMIVQLPPDDFLRLADMMAEQTDRLEAEGRHRDRHSASEQFRRALCGAAGVWEDHPAFKQSEDMREWRRRLWAPDQARLDSPAE